MENKQAGSDTKYWAVVAAAGLGLRMGGVTPKQYLNLLDKPIIQRSIEVLLSHEKIQKVVVVLHPEDHHWSSLSLPKSENIITTVGGTERAFSVKAGLDALDEYADANDFVLVHDAARPCLQHEDIDRLINQIAEHPVGGILGLAVRDCLKRIDDDARITQTFKRDHVWQAQTPQMFRYGLLEEALTQAIEKKSIIFDESQVIEQMGLRPLMVHGNLQNIKVTHQEDLKLAEQFLKNRDLAKV